MLGRCSPVSVRQHVMEGIDTWNKKTIHHISIYVGDPSSISYGIFQGLFFLVMHQIQQQQQQQQQQQLTSRDVFTNLDLS